MWGVETIVDKDVPCVSTLASMHVDMNCFFMLISTRRGVKVISFGLLLSLIEEYWHFNRVRTILKLAMFAPVVLGLIHDNGLNRWLMLNLFTLCQPLIFLWNLYKYSNVLVDNVLFAKELCWLSQQWIDWMGSDKEREEADPCVGEEADDDCEAQADQCPALPGGVLKVIFVITPLIILINLHFMFVLYAHWRNRNLHPNQGGCGEPDN